MRKKFLIRFLAVSLCVCLLTGCGKNEDEAFLTDEEDTAETSGSKETTGANESTDPIKDTNSPEDPPSGPPSISSTTLNYFYLDAIANQYSAWQESFSNYTDQYLKQYFGLDTSVALDLQYCNSEEKLTWADYFVQVAKEDARSCYAIYSQAQAADYQLTGVFLDEYNGWIETYESYAKLYDVTVDEMIENNYGSGTFETWKAYLKIVLTAQAYANDHAENLTYDDAAMREYEKSREQEYNAYSYLSYHLSHTKYGELETIEERLAAAKKDAESLLGATSLEELNAMIAALPCNAGNSSACATKAEDAAYADLNTNLREWLSDPARKVGDATVIANVTATVNEDGTESSITNGFFVIFFNGVNHNTRPLANVRHLLITFKGSTDEDKAAAKAEAERLLALWQEKPTEENFIELVKEHSEDEGSAQDGGLYENISPATPFVENFLKWSIDESRVKGDAGIVETEYGYHIMYYVGDSEITYRDSMIIDEMREADHVAWLEQVIDGYAVIFESAETVNMAYVIADHFG